MLQRGNRMVMPFFVFWCHFQLCFIKRLGTIHERNVPLHLDDLALPVFVHPFVVFVKLADRIGVGNRGQVNVIVSSAHSLDNPMDCGLCHAQCFGDHVLGVALLISSQNRFVSFGYLGDGLEDLFQIFGLGFRIGIGSAYQRGCFFHLIKLAAVWFGIQKCSDGFGVLLVVLHDP